MSAELPIAPPSVVDAAGQPAFGAYQGYARAPWAELRSPHARGRVWRALHAKRWHWVGILTERCVASFAVIDVGWATSAFAYLFDREARRLRADLSFMGAPRLSAQVAEIAGDGARSTFRAPGVSLRLERLAGSGAWRVVADVGRRLAIDATLDAGAAPPTLCAVAPISGGVANCTHKTACLPARGWAEADGARFELDGGTAQLDHTNGLLARDTRWRWASGGDARLGLGLNLVEGFNGPVENVVWADGRAIPVGDASFAFDAKAPLRPWTVRTAGGEVELVFTPEGARAEHKELVVAASRYVQPIGSFTGTLLGRRVERLPGVTEDHVARW